MSEIKANSKWKRVWWWALRIYAGVCTLLITTYLAFVIWSLCFPRSSEIREAIIMGAYGEYMAKEHPKRAGSFWRLTTTLGTHSREFTVLAADILKYLGKPDLITGTTEMGTLVYFYDHPGATGRWAVYASLKDSKLVDIRFNDATVNDHSRYRTYPQ